MAPQKVCAHVVDDDERSDFAKNKLSVSVSLSSSRGRRDERSLAVEPSSSSSLLSLSTTTSPLSASHSSNRLRSASSASAGDETKRDPPGAGCVLYTDDAGNAGDAAGDGTIKVDVDVALDNRLQGTKSVRLDRTQRGHRQESVKVYDLASGTLAGTTCVDIFVADEDHEHDERPSQITCSSNEHGSMGQTLNESGQLQIQEIALRRSVDGHDESPNVCTEVVAVAKSPPRPDAAPSPASGAPKSRARSGTETLGALKTAGWLWYHVRMIWKPRYFMYFEGGHLIFFRQSKTEQEARAQGPDGKIDLTRDSIVVKSGNRRHKRFRLSIIRRGQPMVRLAADDAHEREKWVDALCQFCGLHYSQSSDTCGPGARGAFVAAGAGGVKGNMAMLSQASQDSIDVLLSSVTSAASLELFQKQKLKQQVLAREQEQQKQQKQKQHSQALSSHLRQEDGHQELFKHQSFRLRLPAALTPSKMTLPSTASASLSFSPGLHHSPLDGARRHERADSLHMDHFASPMQQRQHRHMVNQQFMHSNFDADVDMDVSLDLGPDLDQGHANLYSSFSKPRSGSHYHSRNWSRRPRVASDASLAQHFAQLARAVVALDVDAVRDCIDLLGDATVPPADSHTFTSSDDPTMHTPKGDEVSLGRMDSGISSQDANLSSGTPSTPALHLLFDETDLRLVDNELHGAARRRIIELLVQHNPRAACAKIQNRRLDCFEGDYVLHAELRRPQPDLCVLESILQASPEALYRCNEITGEYPIHLACATLQLSAVRVLLRHDPHCATMRNGKSLEYPLHAVLNLCTPDDCPEETDDYAVMHEPEVLQIIDALNRAFTRTLRRSLRTFDSDSPSFTSRKHRSTPDMGASSRTQPAKGSPTAHDPLEATNASAQSVLHLAAQFHSTRVVRRLLELAFASGSINKILESQDYDLRTPLHIAAARVDETESLVALDVFIELARNFYHTWLDRHGASSAACIRKVPLRAYLTKDLKPRANACAHSAKGRGLSTRAHTNPHASGSPTSPSVHGGESYLSGLPSFWGVLFCRPKAS
ncbi:Hypothetical Protein FCC1311_051652 [Hondaea fermentalgiana]|uniref:PH domain-containing protein n=1 Tax=Hondaea fermentalgiana TaxID=2315210 RepID=A0A2R5GM44_9STRA|nr:Hypothetical Protein FCC1311_051652 [Hondaea fermentalgiana]|eukprot:GBG28944.1 Hypothetical Protein FCC1311_051652 [Hondaea fermentalgiana]